MKKLFTLALLVFLVSAHAQNFNWTKQSSGTSTWLNDIHFVDEMHGWSVGDRGVILSTKNGGENWTAQLSGTGEKLRSVFFLDQDTGWISGGQNFLVVLKTVDGGENWTSTKASIPGVSWFDRIQFSNASHGYAIRAWNIYSTEDGGKIWREESYHMDIAENHYLRDLHVLSDTSAFTCGKYKNSIGLSRPGVFDNLTNIYGEWTPHGASEFDTDDELTAIHFTDDQKGFVGGMNGKIYTMEADGTIFPSVWYENFDTKQGWIWSIDFSNSERGMFNTSTEEGGVTIQLIYHTGNAGESWSAGPDRIEGLLSATLSSPHPEHAWIAGSAGLIYKGEPKFPLSNSSAGSIDFSISPNPFVSEIRISSPDKIEGATVTIINNTGQQVKILHFEESGNNFEVSGLEELQSGIYFVNLSSSQGAVQATQKLIKY